MAILHAIRRDFATNTGAAAARRGGERCRAVGARSALLCGALPRAPKSRAPAARQNPARLRRASGVAARAPEAVAVAKEPAAAADVATIVPATDKPIDEGLPPPAGQLAGKTFVISGVFDGISGPKSVGLRQGKDGVKECITRFGGRVVSAVSRKVDYVVVGAEPGAGKVGQAIKLGKEVVDFDGLVKLIAGEAAEGANITSFSAGFRGANGLAARLGSDAVEQLKAAVATKRIAGPVAEPMTEKKVKLGGGALKEARLGRRDGDEARGAGANIWA